MTTARIARISYMSATIRKFRIFISSYAMTKLQQCLENVYDAGEVVLICVGLCCDYAVIAEKTGTYILFDKDVGTIVSTIVGGTFEVSTADICASCNPRFSALNFDKVLLPRAGDELPGDDLHTCDSNFLAS